MILVDSSYWIAASVEEDPHSAAARLLARTHAEELLLTTNHVRGETWTVLQRRFGHGAGTLFLDRLRRGRVETAYVSEAVEEDALDWLRRHPEREYSFVDATCFAFMRAHGITRALSFDEDFEAAGFELLRAD